MNHTIEKLTTASEISALIDDRIIGKNAYRNRAIMKDRFIDGYSYEMIAEKHEMSVQQVKNICYKCLDKIADYI